MGVAQNPQSLQPALEKKGWQKDWPALAAVLTVLVVAAAFWLRFTPPGFWGKLQAIGYAVCHQIPQRSFHVGGHSSPLCARCTGMYLGAFLALVFQLRQGRKAKFPPLAVMISLGLFLVAFGVDGINSFLHFFPDGPSLYTPTNLLRLLTGLGVGVGIGLILYPIFNQTVWRDWRAEAVVPRYKDFLLLLALAGLLALGLLSGQPVILYPAFILSGISVPLIFSIIYTMVAVLLMRRDNKITDWRELLLPASVGLLLALLQIGLTDWVRLGLTGTWGAIIP